MVQSRLNRRHLTRRGACHYFQIRIPRDLDPDAALAPIRLSLGAMPMRAARRRADLLAGVADLLFDELRRLKRVESTASDLRSLLDRGLLPVLRRLALVSDDDQASGAAARTITAHGLAGLRALAGDEANEGVPRPVDAFREARPAFRRRGG